MATVYIGADVDCKMTELAFEVRPGKVRRQRVPTTVRALRQALAEVGGTKRLTFEEGPMAQWLYRNLKADVTEVIVCDPRRNRLISDDGDKADPIDAAKLAELYRGRFLRQVYHSDDDRRVLLKEWVSLYYDRVTDAVRQVNKIRARCRMHGLRPPRGAMRNDATWLAWLDSLADHPVAGQLRLLAVGLQAVRTQVKEARKVMEGLAEAYPVVAAWKELPGWVRSGRSRCSLTWTRRTALPAPRSCGSIAAWACNAAPAGPTSMAGRVQASCGCRIV